MARAPARAAPANPYKGLRAFQEADAADFFGREALTDRLLARLAETSALARFLAVVGPCGSGKSSVVRAGLLPALRRGGAARLRRAGWSSRWSPARTRWKSWRPPCCASRANPPGSLLDQLRADERGLLRAVKRVLPDGCNAVELLLVIDQFEEVFTLVADEAARVHFLESLLRAP